ncbi:PKD domain-containing protein, partial [bacterium]|nr:PKD domain-containing protein [bacterium]
MATSLILSALALLLLVLGGCSGVSKGNVTTPASRPAGQPAAPAQEQPDVTPVGFAGALPPPSDLAGQLDVPRQASLYTELDLIKHGKDFDAALPHNNDAVSSNSVEFSPSWSEAAGMTMDNLGYCIYQFQIPGYDRSPEVRYGWEEPPTDIGTAWFGLADWDLDRWVWFQGKVDGVLTTPSFDPFISSTDVLLAVVVLANDEVSKLRYVRLGPLVLHPYIQASPKVGLPPLEVNFNASGSTVDVGTIVNYEWDLDGDGTYEQDTGLTATASHTYGDTGEFTATVRVTSSYGVQATASDTVKGVAPWIHSWGGSKYEEILRIAFDGGDHLYAIGNTFSYGAGNFDVLLLKYTVEGELVWAKAWGGPINDAGRDLAFDGNGNLITLGHTYSYGSGRSDVLVQKWTSEGEVLWSRTWGGVEHEFVDAVAVSAGAIYVLAQTESYGDGNGDILLLKYDLDGNLLWARTWGGPGIDDPKDMQTVYNFIAGTTTFLITGSTTSYGGGNHDVLYLRFTESGD